MVIATQDQNLTESKIGYFTGIIDGEGCLTITKVKKQELSEWFSQYTHPSTHGGPEHLKKMRKSTKRF
ncbi:MAG: hypothetical protein ACE5R6_00665 [Candidatus Heimdallarchaeota archaeon]